MKRLGFISCIYFSIIYGTCTGFQIQGYRGFILILSAFFFCYWSIVSSDFFSNHRWLRWIQYIQYFILAVYIFSSSKQLLKGSRECLNRLFDCLNTTFHRQFTYYVPVAGDNLQADLFVFITILLLLFSGILLLSRRHSWVILIETMSLMLLLMIFSPQAIHADFFIYFAGIVGMYYLEHDKEKSAVIGSSILIFCALFFLIYPSTEIFGQNMTAIRRGSLVFAENINHVINGEQSIYQLNFGDLKKKANEKEKKTQDIEVFVQNPEYVNFLRSYVGSNYKNGKWKQQEQEDMENLLEDASSLLSLNRQWSRILNPSMQTMHISYLPENKEEKKLLPYYTLEKNGNEISYLCIKDFDRFLSNSDRIYEWIESRGKNSNLQSYERRNSKEKIKKDWGKSATYQKIRKENSQIPSSMKKQLRTIAKELYDPSYSESNLVNKVISYVNKNYTYSKELSKVPKNKDPVSYFLFESKRGNISQFASAQVFLLRSLKIPARYAEGYLASPFNQNNASLTKGEMVVSLDEKNAYAWGEFYKEGIGWIPFDPIITNGLVAQSDEREIELPNLPRITLTTKELFTHIVNLFFDLILLVLLRAFVIFVIEYRRKNRMTRKQRVLWYARIWENQASLKKSEEVEKILERAEYSDHEISQEEEELVLKQAVEARNEYRSNLSIFVIIYDILIACKDIL